MWCGPLSGVLQAAGLDSGTATCYLNSWCHRLLMGFCLFTLQIADLVLNFFALLVSTYLVIRLVRTYKTFMFRCIGPPDHVVKIHRVSDHRSELINHTDRSSTTSVRPWLVHMPPGLGLSSHHINRLMARPTSQWSNRIHLISHGPVSQRFRNHPCASRPLDCDWMAFRSFRTTSVTKRLRLSRPALRSGLVWDVRFPRLAVDVDTMAILCFSSSRVAGGPDGKRRSCCRLPPKLWKRLEGISPGGKRSGSRGL